MGVRQERALIWRARLYRSTASNGVLKTRHSSTAAMHMGAVNVFPPSIEVDTT
jgi:hypothetical protein